MRCIEFIRGDSLSDLIIDSWLLLDWSLRLNYAHGIDEVKDYGGINS